MAGAFDPVQLQVGDPGVEALPEPGMQVHVRIAVDDERPVVDHQRARLAGVVTRCRREPLRGTHALLAIPADHAFDGAGPSPGLEIDLPVRFGEEVVAVEDRFQERVVVLPEPLGAVGPAQASQ